MTCPLRDFNVCNLATNCNLMAFMSHINVLECSISKKMFSFVIFVPNIFKEILNSIVNPVFAKYI